MDYAQKYPDRPEKSRTSRTLPTDILMDPKVTLRLQPLQGKGSARSERIYSRAIHVALPMSFEEP